MKFKIKALLLVNMILTVSCFNNKNADERELQKSEFKSVNRNPENFNTFFERFSNDSIFQKTRIKLPLKCDTLNDDYDKLITFYLSKPSDLTYMAFSKDTLAMKQQYDKYTTKKEKTKNGMIYWQLGYDNGIRISYEFCLIKNYWHLVSITDEST